MKKTNRLVELNFGEKVHKLDKTMIVQKAWKRSELQVHGWVYGFEDGLIKDLNVSYCDIENVEPIFRYDL